MRFILWMALCLFAHTAQAQIITKNPVATGAVTPEEIGKRLDAAAERTRAASSKGGARGAVIDFAWPQDEAEYRALGKYVVVLVSAVSQSEDELPVRKVYVQPARGPEIVLEKINSERVSVSKDSPAYSMLGPYREDSFYLAPANAMMGDGTLLVDFAVRRNGFRLYELPGTPPDFVQADRHPVPAPGAKPDPKALKTMLGREYSGFKLPPGLQ